MFAIALALLIVGVWAVGETQHINLSGNVDFTISDNNLYIKDIRFRDAGSSEQGTTIDNFIPGFVKSSFELNLGSFDVDSDFDLIIDVVNTTTTIYEVNTSFDISNGLVAVSGRIEGDGVPLAEVSTADISGQIILNVTITSAGIVDLDQVDIPLTEYIPQVYDYFTFEVNYGGKTVTLTGYDSSLSDSTDVVIPTTVSQNSSGEWIEGNTYTVTAIIDGGFTSGVFYDSGITSVTFPSSLTSIGEFAFYNCSGLTGELNLGECTSLTSIGDYAFSVCSGLTGELNLGGCTSLTSIGWYAFNSCSGLTSITLPSSLTSIGNNAFYRCSGLTGELNLGGCTSLTSIGISVFNSCSGLTSITLPSSLTSIGWYAFDGCRGLTGELNLGGCTSLTSIGDYAFQSCRGLTGTVTIPASVTEIGINPFARCSNLEGIVVEEGNSEYYVEGNCLIENSTKTLITGFNDSTIPSDIKIIGIYAFDGCSGLTSISLPSGLTSIGDYAFRDCDGLTSVDLSGCISLTSIGDNAFCDCSGLTSVDLSGCTSLTSIERYAFSHCSALKSVIFPEGSTGWYVTTSSSATSGTSVTVTDPSVNANKLTGQYCEYYWKRG